MEYHQDHVHSFESTIIPATCQARGYTQHRCACGYEYKDQFTPLGEHSYALIDEQAPTCQSSGCRESRCSVCGDTISQTLPALGHDWTPWNVTQVALCENAGLRCRQCHRCGEQQEDVLPATGHKCSKGAKNARGTVEYYCLNCGQPMEKPVKKASPKKKKAIFGIVAALLVVAVLVVVSALFLQPVYNYYAAQHHIKKEQYEDAYYHLLKCRDFKDSNELLKDFTVLYESESCVYTYYLADGSIERESYSKYEREYDQHGNLIQRCRYSDGQLSFKDNYEYNAAGQKTLSVHYNTDGQQSYKYIYEYDAGGNLILEEKYDGKDRLLHRYTYKYDEKGNLIETVCRQAGTSKEKTTCTNTYDESGNLIEVIRYDAQGRPESIITYTYDTAGNRIRCEECDRYGYLQALTEWDPNGYMTTEASYFDLGKQLNYKYTYQYDAQGNQLAYTSYADYNDENTYEYTYKLDENGNRIYTTLRINGGEETRWHSGKYTYDKYGMLIEGTTYTQDGKTSTKTEYSKDYQKKEETTYHYNTTDNGDSYLQMKRVNKLTDMVICYTPKEDK